MRVPADVKIRALEELEATRLLRPDQAYARIFALVPRRFWVEMVESPLRPRRLIWPTEHDEPALPLGPPSR